MPKSKSDCGHDFLELDLGIGEIHKVEPVEDDGDVSSLVRRLSDLDLPESTPPVPSQNTRGAAVIATENDQPWLNTRGAATYSPAPQTTPRTALRIVRRRPCESRHRRSSRSRPTSRRSSRRTTAPTRAGPGGSDPPGLDDEPPGERRLLIGGRR